MPCFLRIFLLAGYLLPATGLFAQNSNWEYLFLRQLEEKRTEAGNRFNKNLSAANDWICAGVPAVLFTAGVLKGNPEMKKQGLMIGGSLVLSSILTKGLKWTIDRPRPAEKDSSFTAVLFKKGHSFPSGHSSLSFSMATSLSLQFRRWYIVVPAFGYACLVSWSRLSLGVHYPTDVLAGAITGAGSAWLTERGNHWLQKRKSKKTELLQY